MGARQFDYYIFIDYSENFVGYLIVSKEKLRVLLPKINKFSHFNEVKNKLSYIHSIKKLIETKNILLDILKFKIRETRQNLEVYSDVLNFIKNNDNCIIFVSIDNHEFSNFKTLVNIANGGNTKLVLESQLKEKSDEYKMSLILDTLLNIERVRRKQR